MNGGFQRGRAALTIFYHPQTHMSVVVQGDDFPFAATESELRRGCANGTTSRCVTFLAKFEVDRGRGSTRRVTNIARHCWKAWGSARNRRESTAQESSQMRSEKTKTRECWRERRRGVWRLLHESGQGGRAIRREGDSA